MKRSLWVAAVEVAVEEEIADQEEVVVEIETVTAEVEVESEVVMSEPEALTSQLVDLSAAKAPIKEGTANNFICVIY
jgi:hypothetical protein